MATKTNTTINGKDYFRIRKVIGEKDGKPVRKAFYGRSKAEAENKYDEFKDELLRQKYEQDISADLSTFSDRAEEFIENALKPSQKYAQGTIGRYTSAYYNHIRNSSLSDMVAYKIKASDIQKFYNNLDVSENTMKQINKFMSAFYKWMIVNGYATDVLSAVEIPKKKSTKRHEEITVWDEEEVQRILDNIDGYRLRFLIIILLYSGARIGEALALKYSDIDGDVIHIKRQFYAGEIKDPKMGSSRDIPLHERIKEELEIHKAWHEREMKKKKYSSEYIFTTETGKLIDRANLRRSLLRFYKRAGIEARHTHAYRGTFCTQLCKCGVPLEVASKLLGHKDITVTAKYYALIQPESKKAAIQLLHY